MVCRSSCTNDSYAKESLRQLLELF